MRLAPNAALLVEENLTFEYDGRLRGLLPRHPPARRSTDRQRRRLRGWKGLHGRAAAPSSAAPTSKAPTGPRRTRRAGHPDRLAPQGKRREPHVHDPLPGRGAVGLRRRARPRMEGLGRPVGSSTSRGALHRPLPRTCRHPYNPACGASPATSRARLPRRGRRPPRGIRCPRRPVRGDARDDAAEPGSGRRGRAGREPARDSRGSSRRRARTTTITTPPSTRPSASSPTTPPCFAAIAAAGTRPVRFLPPGPRAADVGSEPPSRAARRRLPGARLRPRPRR